MPITAGLENIKKLESVGFTHKQAEVLAEIQESTAQDTVRELKDFIHTEIKEFRSEMNSRFEAVEKRFEVIDRRFDAINGRFDAVNGKFDAYGSKLDLLEQRLKTAIAESKADLLIKIFGIIIGSLSIAVAILKLTS